MMHLSVIPSSSLGQHLLRLEILGPMIFLSLLQRGTNNTGSKSVLTVQNVGDHLLGGYRYPVLAINAIKYDFKQHAF